VTTRGEIPSDVGWGRNNRERCPGPGKRCFRKGPKMGDDGSLVQLLFSKGGGIKKGVVEQSGG